MGGRRRYVSVCKQIFFTINAPRADHDDVFIKSSYASIREIIIIISFCIIMIQVLDMFIVLINSFIIEG